MPAGLSSTSTASSSYSWWLWRNSTQLIITTVSYRGHMAAVDLARWEGDVVLSDGGTVHVRPIRPSDAAALVALHGRLSPESIYFRFFSPKPRLTDKEIERFTVVDFEDRVALVAMLGED